MNEPAKEVWGLGSAYDRWMGRWSRTVAPEFMHWLDAPAAQTWGDVGCGTGVLVERILAEGEPSAVFAIDRSEAYVAEAQRKIADPRVRFEVGDACALPWDTASRDVTVSGLVLNFVPDTAAAMRELMRVTRPGGRVAAYVWDYTGGMQMVRHFWDAAIAVNPGDAKLDQAERFPICREGALEALFADTGLVDVSQRAIEVPAVFRDFDDYWLPFLSKQGAAPTYLASLPAEAQARIRDLLEQRLVSAADGTISMKLRAWAVKASVPPAAR